MKKEKFGMNILNRKSSIIAIFIILVVVVISMFCINYETRNSYNISNINADDRGINLSQDSISTYSTTEGDVIPQSYMDTSISSMENHLREIVKRKDDKVTIVSVTKTNQSYFIPKNFSPYLSDDIDDMLIGLEYFCDEGDEFWQMEDNEIFDFAIDELIKIKAINDRTDIVKAFRTKVKKAYPAYFDTYKEFHKIRGFLDTIENLYCIGRNGQHKYNNMDHSTLSGIIAAQIIKNNGNKSILWDINTEEAYHESTSA